MSDQLSSDLASLRINRTAKRNPEGRSPWRVVLGTAAVLALSGAAYVFGKARIEAEFFKTEVDVTEILLVSPAQASVELTSTGYVVPQVVSQVGAKIPGRVSGVHVKEGDNVKQGDLLLELDASDVQAQKRAAEARVGATRARALAARAQFAETGVQFEREKRLVAEGVSPKATTEDLEAHMKALDANVHAADADAFSALSDVNTSNVNLGYLKIYSPIDGRVISKPPQLGELVGALTLTPLTIEIADMTTLMVETDVAEARLEQVKPKAPCEIVLDAYPDRRFRGEVYEVSPKVNRQKATVLVKVRFIDATDDVLPEMAARVSFLTEAIDAAAIKQAPKLVVPAAAIVTRAGTKDVFVLDGEKVRLVPITVGAPFGGGLELLAGPGAGTRVVKNPPDSLGDGQKIKQRGDA